jgi:TolB-like protein
MSSLIAGYQYDVFISYRQKDNRREKWVSEFVEALKTELESTFKEEISVYFDLNPHDGLLETQDVDASLKDKLKCLVFIPIISRTYCDPKSFAWEHEFRSFVEKATHDEFGMKVILSNGNVANRVLPVRIHDLDSDDMKLCESILGGALRGVEFIYKEPGVDRPLSPDDDEKINLNKTKYRNQVNKVALAIKDIITTIRKHNQMNGDTPKEVIYARPVKIKFRKITTIIVSALIMAMSVLGYIFIPKLIKSSSPVEKSIAVLPFKLLSDEPDKQYLADGMMEAILFNLSKIKDLRVVSSTSVEQYRVTTKTTYQIGKELDVEYLLEGRFQKEGNDVKVIVQLIKAREDSHKWSDEYNRKWDDIFAVQSEVAQAIASVLKANLTSEEKLLIDKIPTTNLTAYDFYQRGREEHKKYWNDNGNKIALQRAEVFYHESLKYDSTFAQAYSGLAWVYYDKHFWKEYFYENGMDSVLILAKIALSHDNQLSEAYNLMGLYYIQTGKPEQAIEDFDIAIKLNPNDGMAYYEKGIRYYSTDLVNQIDYLQKAASINRGTELPALLSDIAWAYYCAGFPEKAKRYYQDRLKLDGDSVTYYSSWATCEYLLTNFNKSIEFAKKACAIDSTWEYVWECLGDAYASLGQYKESLKCFNKWLEVLKAHESFEANAINNMHRIGYAYWQNGYKEEAEYYFNEQIKNCNRVIELNRQYLGEKLYSYYDLAGVYAFKGVKDKAYQNLENFNKVQHVSSWMANLIKFDPLFNTIRNEPEFQKIVKDVEAKYQAEHERVRKWLEENNML